VEATSRSYPEKSLPSKAFLTITRMLPPCPLSLVISSPPPPSRAPPIQPSKFLNAAKYQGPKGQITSISPSESPGSESSSPPLASAETTECLVMSKKDVQVIFEKLYPRMGARFYRTLALYSTMRSASRWRVVSYVPQIRAPHRKTRNTRLAPC
jgi:hypothetical protein